MEPLAVEQPDGRGVEHSHLPHRLVCTDSRCNTASIVAVIKTQGSDIKLAGQMQPYSEARSPHPAELAGLPIAPVVTQIADGENGGVMMNEFPPKYFQVTRERSGAPTPAVNITAYLEMLARLGIRDGDMPVPQLAFQQRVWERFQSGEGSRPACRSHRRAQRRRRPVQHGRRQLDQRRVVGARISERAGADAAR